MEEGQWYLGDVFLPRLSEQGYLEILGPVWLERQQNLRRSLVTLILYVVPENNTSFLHWQECRCMRPNQVISDVLERRRCEHLPMPQRQQRILFFILILQHSYREIMFNLDCPVIKAFSYWYCTSDSNITYLGYKQK